MQVCNITKYIILYTFKTSKSLNQKNYTILGNSFDSREPLTKPSLRIIKFIDYVIL